MAGVENRALGIALAVPFRLPLGRYCNPLPTHGTKTSDGKMDSILSFFQLAFCLPKTSAGKMDSILSFWNLEQLSQAIPQFLRPSGLSTLLLHPALCPSPGSLWDQQGMGQQDFSLCPSPGSLWDRRGMGHQEVEGNLHWISLEDTGAKRTKKHRLGFEPSRPSTAFV